MGSFNRSVSKRWWRDFEYIPKHSKWLLESIQGACGTMKEMIKVIEAADEDERNTPAIRAEKRLNLIEKVEEMCKAYYELAEQHDQLVGASHTYTLNQNKLSDQNSHKSYPVKAKQLTRLQSLKKDEIEEAVAPYNALAAQLNKVESELTMVKSDLAKKEAMISNSEKLKHKQNSNLESLQLKLEWREKELEQKGQEIERMKAMLNEVEANKVSSDIRGSMLEEENKILKVQKVSYEKRLSTLTKDLDLLNKTIKKLEKDNLRDKRRVELQEKELEQKREEIDKMNLKLNEIETQKVSLDNRVADLEEKIRTLNVKKVSYEEKIGNLQKEISLLNETKENIKKEVGLHLTDKENICRDLSSKIEDISKVNAMRKEEIMKYEIEKEEFSQKNALLENSLSKANLEKNKACTQVFLLEEEIMVLNQKLAEAELCNLEEAKAISMLNKEIEILNKRKHSTSIIINKFIKILFGKETNVFLSNSHVWRKRTGGGAECFMKGLGVVERKWPELHFWLYYFWGFLCRFLRPINYHLGAYIGSIRTVLHFYGSFLAAHFPSKQVANEIDSELTMSNNPQTENRDGTDGEVNEVNGTRQSRNMPQLEMEVQEN